MSYSIKKERGSGPESYIRHDHDRDNSLPSNAHILLPLFQKTLFFSKIFFGKPPSKLLEVRGMSKFGIYVIMKSSLQF
jgi:hypothetical protein